MQTNPQELYTTHETEGDAELRHSETKYSKLKVKPNCDNCGKPRNPEIKTVRYNTEDDLSETVGFDNLPWHRAVFCSQRCRVVWINETMDPDMTSDDLLREVEEYRKLHPDELN